MIHRVKVSVVFELDTETCKEARQIAMETMDGCELAHKYEGTGVMRYEMKASEGSGKCEACREREEKEKFKRGQAVRYIGQTLRKGREGYIEVVPSDPMADSRPAERYLLYLYPTRMVVADRVWADSDDLEIVG